MKVQFFDIQSGVQELRHELDEACRRVMDSGWYVLGREVESFEQEFAAYLGLRHCVGVGNGLEAIHLALLALGIGGGDHVLVPANTFIATWLAVSQTGAIPVPVDADPATGNVDVALLESCLTPRTRAIIAVHLYGQPAAMDGVLDFARRHGLRVIEDAAQAHGASWRGRRAGGLADAGAFSFYPTKNLGCFGDGGAVTTNDDDLARRLRLLRNYGSRVKYVHECRGFNSRLDELQAALLRVKLRHLQRWNQRRTEIAGQYQQALANVAGLALPQVLPAAEPVWHLYVVRHRQRDQLAEHLHRLGIGTMVHYPTPPHLSPAYAAVHGTNSLPVTEELSRQVLSLPMGPHMSPEDVNHVIHGICMFAQQDARRQQGNSRAAA